jgi:predicted nucleotidyltransferase
MQDLTGEIKMNSLIIANKPAILNLAKQHGVKTICLFGSMARGDTNQNSDVDFLVELEQGRDLFDLGELLIDLQNLLQRKIDLVTKNALHPRIYAEVLKEALPL